MKDKRVVPIKNYYILAIIAIVTIGFVFYLVDWYQNSQENKPGVSVLSGTVSEVKSDELSNYLLDNPNIVIYLASSKDENNKGFEKKLKKYLLDEEISNEFVYLDINEIKDKAFYNEFVNNYYDEDLKNKNISLDYFPNMVLVKDGKVKDVLIKYDSSIKINEVEEFLQRHEILIK